MQASGSVTEPEIPAVLQTGLAHRQRETFHIEGFRRAAVLVPLLSGPEGVRLLFTVRAAHLSNHGGQIAFPGGQVEAGEDAVEAALRETFEETGLRIDPGSVVGLLNDHPTPTGYVVTPVVAVHTGDRSLQLNPDEVTEAFTVPLEELRRIEPQSEVRRLHQHPRRIFSYTYRNRRIWGFTGNVVQNLLQILELADPP